MMPLTVKDTAQIAVHQMLYCSPNYLNGCSESYNHRSWATLLLDDKRVLLEKKILHTLHRIVHETHSVKATE